MKIKDLSRIALMYRAMAASVFNSDKAEYERLEAAADEHYDMAEEYGADFVRVPRLSGVTLETACKECGTEFLPERTTAMFCSDACRKKSNRRARG